MRKVADLFCGAGGETTGIMRALGEIGGNYDVAAVNHWDIAIDTYRKNYPGARAFCMSLEQLNPLDVFDAHDKIDLLWASPECTHHSNARGGRPCSNQSRASAWLILKWLSELYVRKIIIENVPEFLSWGPLGIDGRPLASKKGESFKAFIHVLESIGYTVDWRILCAADYGDPTIRRRLFIQAVRGHAKISWPEPDFSEDYDLFGKKPWRSAKEIIDWSIQGHSIFNRKHPLAPATISRIAKGIERYWGEWAKPFLVMLYGQSTTWDMERPTPTVTTSPGHIGLVRPFVLPQFGGSAPRDTDKPLTAVTTTSRGMGLVQPFIFHQDAPGRPRLISEPVPAIRTRNGHGIVEPFLVEYYGQGGANPIRVPLSTITTKDRFAMIEGHAGLDITFRMLQPHELAAAQGFPMDYYFAGNKSEQIKQIGNAVPVNLAHALAIEALA